MRPVLAFTADWHISEGAWRHKGVTGDAWYSLEQVVDYCEVNLATVEWLIAAGDLFDTDDPDPKSVSFVSRQMDRMAKIGMNVGYIVGQHERHRGGGRWMNVHDWPISIDGGTWLPQRGAQIFGIDWTSSDRLPERIASIPEGTTILVLHQVCKELMDINHELVLANIPGDAMIVVGDYHQARIFQAGRHTVVSPGSFAMQSIDEDPQKSFVVLDDEGKLHTIPLKSRQVGHFEVWSPDDLDRFLADRPWTPLLEHGGLPPALQRPIVSVRFLDEIPAIARRLSEALAEEVHYFPQAVSRKKLLRQQNPEERMAVGAFDLVAALGEALPQDSPLLPAARRLLQAGPKRFGPELATIRQEFMAKFVESVNGDGQVDPG